MKKLITVSAIVLLFSSAIPMERKRPYNDFTPAYHIRQVNVVYDSLAMSLEGLSNKLDQLP
ncbi:hypothetical protein LY11_03132 [Pedobacter cryoconitis]|uniref:Uncharacterized protein n=1 Tax=Pedobacter cryoconitis TaxID=188932 RepID=A0A327SJF6_9SPHI|nr:hypothetical protein LY11_03132 [Pedobacter cryoconitis]